MNKDKTIVDLHIALQYANDRHDGQMYSDKPYMFHLLEVLKNCQEFDLNIECQIVSVLHDVLEDTCHSDKELFDTYNEIQKMFGFEIAKTICDLSHDRLKENYSQYINRVKQNPMAQDVKLCDIIANLEASILSNDTRRIKKYKKALFNIGGAY